MHRVVLLSLIRVWSLLLMRVARGGMTPAAVGTGIALVRERFRLPRPTAPPPGAVAAVALVVLVALGACGGGGHEGGDGAGRPSTSSSAACGPEVEEPLDPGSTQHVLPGAPEPAYAGDPPTSGPHLAGGAVTGAQPAPLSRPVQVAVLEEGGVMVQHRGLDAGPRARLEALAADGVVVAPNPGLPAPVVVTAWRRRLTCTSADADAISAIGRFVDAHRGQATGSD